MGERLIYWGSLREHMATRYAHEPTIDHILLLKLRVRILDSSDEDYLQLYLKLIMKSFFLRKIDMSSEFQSLMRI